MTYQEAKTIKANLYKNLEEKGLVLRAFATGNMGLTPDEVKFSAEFQKAKKEYDIVFQKVREFNKFFFKNFKKEYNKERSQKKL